jgi:hypothetical protein
MGISTIGLKSKKSIDTSYSDWLDWFGERSNCFMQYGLFLVLFSYSI